jgi:hypothetical protein
MSLLKLESNPNASAKIKVRMKIGILLGSLSVALILFPYAYHFGLYHDDFLILDNIGIKSVFGTEGATLFRPIPLFLLWLISGTSHIVFWGHLLNGAIAYGTVALGMVLVLQIVHGSDLKKGDRWQESLFVFTIFISLAFHYSTTWNYIWISGVQTLLWGVFVVLSFLCFKGLLARGMKKEGILLAEISTLLIIYILAILSYEASLTIPILLGVVYLHEQENQNALAKQTSLFILYLGYIAIASLFMLLRFSLSIHRSSAIDSSRIFFSAIEFFFSLLGPTHKPIITSWIEQKNPISGHDIATIILVSIAFVGCLLFVLLNCVKHTVSKKPYLPLVGILILLLSAGPIFWGRRAFSGRLAFGFIVPFAVLLAYSFRSDQQKRRIALLSSTCWMLLGINSFINFVHFVPSISRLKEEWTARLVHEHRKKSILGLNFDSFYGYYGIGPTPEVLRSKGIDVGSSGMVCTVIDADYRPSLETLGEVVGLAEISNNPESYSFSLRTEKAYIHEQNFYGRYTAG